MKKKICIILPSLSKGGAEKVAFHILNNLDLEKYELYLLQTLKEGDYVKKLRKEIKVSVLNSKAARYSIFKIYKELKNIKPDIVIVFSMELATVIGLAIVPFFKNISFIARELNIQSLLTKNKLRLYLLRLAYRNYRKIISQSKDMTNDLIENTKVNRSNIVEINNPVDIEEINKVIHNSKEKVFDLEYKNLVCVGRLVEQKGFDLIIKIMPLLMKEKIRLYIIGEGQQKQYLKNLIDSLSLNNIVFLLGKRENPYVYMKEADLFILSSRFEGFPNVLVEANACGTYAICNNCLGGVNEIISNGMNGEIINFTEKEKVAEIIKKNLESKKDSYEIVNYIEKKYSIKKIIKKYEIFLDEVMNK